MRQLYIGGAWTASASGEAIEVVNPATEEIIDRVPAGARGGRPGSGASRQESLPLLVGHRARRTRPNSWPPRPSC